MYNVFIDAINVLNTRISVAKRPLETAFFRVNFKYYEWIFFKLFPATTALPSPPTPRPKYGIPIRPSARLAWTRNLRVKNTTFFFWESYNFLAARTFYATIVVRVDIFSDVRTIPFCDRPSPLPRAYSP